MFERVETARLVLRKPLREDAEAIYNRYASDPEVTRLLAWPRHTSLQATYAFLNFSDEEWSRWPAGPYLIESRAGGKLLGSSGLHFETVNRAATGYVLAKDGWGQGYATEALQAVIGVARRVGITRLYALCHPENAPSRRVLEKCGFACEGIWESHSPFPNLSGDRACDVLCYAVTLGP